MIKDDVEWMEKIVRKAEQLAREEGGSFEGWLWYLLQPPGFFVRGNEIIIEYHDVYYTYVKKYIIDRETHKVRVEYEELEDEEYEESEA